VTSVASFAVLAGAGLGALTSLSNVVGSAYSPHAWAPGRGVPALELLAAVLGTVWAWALLPFVVGWAVARTTTAVLAGVLALIAAVTAYYASDAVFGLDDELSTGEIAYWTALALVLAPVMAVLGRLAHQPRRWSLLPGLAPVLLIVLAGGATGPEEIQPWPRAIALCTAAVLAAALTTRALRLPPQK
jgi:hypothetical protein